MIRFSSGTQSMRASAIREMMGMAIRPDIISFAGGMPSNSLFPVEELDAIYSNLSLQIKQAAFQYGPTSGYPPLIESLKQYLKDKGLPLEGNDVIITTGGLQAIYLAAKVLIDPKDPVVTEDPTFVGGLAAFKSFQAELHAVSLDENGIIPSKLAQTLDSLKPSPKLAYLIPNFHNPAGILYSRERRLAVLELLKKQDTVLLEDDAYSELCFDERDRETIVPMKILANESMPICYIGSFSKIFGPGMRLGWILSPKEIHAQCELAKQSVDACSPTFTQVLADAFLRGGYLADYLKRIRPAYKRRAEIMLKSLSENMPEGITWTKPRGGFYIWVTLPERMDASEVLKKSMEKGAVFVVGKTFDPKGERKNCLRLAFSHTAEEKIDSGVKIVAEAVKELIGKAGQVSAQRDAGQ